MDPDLRPDRCKVVIGPATDPKILSFGMTTGYYDAWRKTPGIMDLIKKMVRMDMRAVIDTPVSTTKIVVDSAGEREVEMSEPDESGTQWYIGPAK